MVPLVLLLTKVRGRGISKKDISTLINRSGFQPVAGPQVVILGCCERPIYKIDESHKNDSQHEIRLAIKMVSFAGCT